jgi:DNA-binding beta-propeller fold protein YncE
MSLPAGGEKMASLVMRGWACLGAALFLVAAVPVAATPLTGNSFTGANGAVLYDIDPLTGHAGNPRSTGIDNLVGIAFSPDAHLYGLSNSAAASYANSLFRIDPDTGASELVGPTGLGSVTEGDLAFDRTTGSLYGFWNADQGQRQLFTLDTATGTATVIPGSLSGDPSAMAFAPDGTLYVLDTSLQKLLTVDRASGAILTTTDLSTSLGSTAGMDVHPATGVFYVADGQSGGTDRLYTLDPATGLLTDQGLLGLDTGLAGLAFLPEPGTLLLVMFAGAAMLRRKRN